MRAPPSDAGADSYDVHLRGHAHLGACLEQREAPIVGGPAWALADGDHGVLAAVARVRKWTPLGRSYGQVEAADVRTASGYPGRQLRFTSSVAGRPHRYWATVFVTPTHVFVVEAAGDQAYFDASQEVVEETVLSFDPS